MKYFYLNLLAAAVLSLAATPAIAQNRDCRATPPFTKNQGFDYKRSGFSTSERKTMGLNYVEFAQTPEQKNRTYQHESWRSAGWLGPMVISEKGEIWVAPVPVINLIDNPPEKQTYLYKIDPQTAEMKFVLDLPKPNAPSVENPYGILGMAYDCDNGIIYISSVSGSDRDNERGRIFAVRSSDLRIVAQLDGIDAMGLGVGYVAGEKKLYIGSARNGNILAINLAKDGNFVGNPQTVLSLNDLGPRGDDRARKIRFAPDGTLTIIGIEFYFNLIAPTEKQETNYLFKYNPAQQKWVLASIQ